MAMSGAKGILVVVGLVAVAAGAYFTLTGRSGPDEGVEGAIGAADRHQNEKTRYYKAYYEELEARGDLSAEKIEALGKIAAKLENAPAEAERMLKEHGWSREEFDKMVEVVRGDDELNKMFQAAMKPGVQP